jgi:hypothetical protein
VIGFINFLGSMTMTAISNRLPGVSVEYLRGANRVAKEFAGDDLAAARTFYAQKLASGKDPRVVGERAAEVTAPAAEVDPTVELNEAVAAGAVSKDTGPPVVRLGVDAEAATRGYYAGRLIARRGLAAGIDDALAREVSRLYQPKKLNDRESSFHSRIVWHGVRGFLAELGIDHAALQALVAADNGPTTPAATEAG